MPSRSAKPLRVGAWQFRGSADLTRNRDAILRGLELAARQGIRLLATSECALSGYAGVDITCPEEIDRNLLSECETTIRREAKRRHLWLILGTTGFRQGRAMNTVHLIGPDGRVRGGYDKRGFYGSDAVHYLPGKRRGVHAVDGLKVGLRICYEFRFPEYYRELLRAGARLAVTSFCMVGNNVDKRPVAQGHLVSRAAENGLWMLAVNSLSRTQNSPTCLIDPDGKLVAEAPYDREALLVGSVTRGERPVHAACIVAHARRLLRA